MSNTCPLVWIIIGVSGSGKTTVGRKFSAQLECDFLEGDRRHPLENVTKMMSQQPLQDTDRYQWLLEIENDIRQAITRKREIVITCSSLKRRYRQQLVASGRVQLVWLNVPPVELMRRLTTRVNHYMKPEMLQSQLADFETIGPEENVMTIDGCLSIEETLAELLRQALRQFPTINQSWWQRYADEQ